MPSFFSKLFSSSSSNDSKKSSKFDRLISSVSNTAQYQPDIYDDLRGDGFFFRPSDTISTSTLVTAQSHSIPLATAEGFKSTPNLVRPFTQEEPFELAALSTPVLRPATSYKSTVETRDSAIELPASLATLPSTVYSPPTRHALTLSTQASASTPNLLASRTYDAEIQAHRRAAALALTSNALAFPLNKSLAFASASSLSLPGPYQAVQERQQQHAPLRPSPLALATSVQNAKNADDNAVELPAKSDEDFPIMLSPTTAASLSPPIFSFSPKTRPVSFIKRKPVPSLLLHTALAELPATPVLREGARGTAHELPAELDVSPIEEEEEAVELTLPVLPAHLSRLQTLRQRLSVVGPAKTSPELGGVRLVTLKRKRSLSPAVPSISELVDASIDDVSAVEALSGTSSSSSDLQAYNAGDSIELTTHVDSTDYEDDIESEDDEIIEIGTARVVHGVSGLQEQGGVKRVVRQSMMMNRGKLYLREGLRWWAQKLE